MIVNTKRLDPEDVTDDDNSYEIEAPETSYFKEPSYHQSLSTNPEMVGTVSD